ncbi:MAG: hypothetical protein K2K42_02500 [Eubacterium sp.]|nr:hypothetical protein [Eubacterium sp.]
MADLKVRLLIEDKDGQIKPFTGFTDAQLAAISERLSRTMSAYYTNHPEEWKRLIKSEIFNN